VFVLVHRRIREIRAIRGFLLLSAANAKRPVVFIFYSPQIIAPSPFFVRKRAKSPKIRHIWRAYAQILPLALISPATLRQVLRQKQTHRKHTNPLPANH
jgi:hypothetical protein